MVALTPPSFRSESAKMITNKEIVEAWDKRVGEVEGASSFYIAGQTTQGKHHDMGSGLQIQLRGNDEHAKGISS